MNGYRHTTVSSEQCDFLSNYPERCRLAMSFPSVDTVDCLFDIHHPRRSAASHEIVECLCGFDRYRGTVSIEITNSKSKTLDTVGCGIQSDPRRAYIKRHFVSFVCYNTIFMIDSIRPLYCEYLRCIFVNRRNVLSQPYICTLSTVSETIDVSP